ncbi:hypothetical protein CRG98_001206 [Punica granatum]|uniref:Uncharacterized protein n=1 Tax=Punica granatum TaxID=22663 RepID=A0A2I0LCH3_PUNGR|nr:hypothetical protein CRG98_001206 [Punica granatum]
MQSRGVSNKDTGHKTNPGCKKKTERKEAGPPRTTGESWQHSRVDHLQSSPLHGETCYDQRPSSAATHCARQASRANLCGYTTHGLHFSIATCAVTKSRVQPRPPTAHDRRVVPTFAGRPPAVFTSP